MGGFHDVMGVSLYRWMVFVNGKILVEIDDDLGYPQIINPHSDVSIPYEIPWDSGGDIHGRKNPPYSGSDCWTAASS